METHIIHPDSSILPHGYCSVIWMNAACWPRLPSLVMSRQTTGTLCTSSDFLFSRQRWKKSIVHATSISLLLQHPFYTKNGYFGNCYLYWRRMIRNIMHEIFNPHVIIFTITVPVIPRLQFTMMSQTSLNDQNIACVVLFSLKLNSGSIENMTLCLKVKAGW